jgi:hypothetical protein
MRVDFLAEISVTLFRKGEKANSKELETYLVLDGPCAEDVTEFCEKDADELAGEKFRELNDLIADELRDDRIFTEDWYGISIMVLSEEEYGKDCKRSLISCILDGLTVDELFMEFREDILKLVKFEDGVKSKKILTAWQTWQSGSVSLYDDDYENGIELLGRVNLGEVFILDLEKKPEEPKGSKEPVKTGRIKW